MGEKLHIVVPDGTNKALETKAKKDGHTKSSLARKIILAGLKECEHQWMAFNIDGSQIPEIRCAKCGIPQGKKS